MFELECEANLKSVTLSVKEKDGLTVRRCKMVLEREFDDLIAAAIGSGAKKARSGLISGEMEKVVMPITALTCSADLRAGKKDRVAIGSVVGVKATGKATSEDETPPSIELEFEFLFDEAAWAFLGRNCGALATITMEQRQQELPAA